MKMPVIEERPQTFGEEIADSVSHGIGLAGALVATPVLIVMAVRNGGTAGVVGASIFGASMLLLYLTNVLEVNMEDAERNAKWLGWFAEQF